LANRVKCRKWLRLDRRWLGACLLSVSQSESALMHWQKLFELQERVILHGFKGRWTVTAKEGVMWTDPDLVWYFDAKDAIEHHFHGTVEVDGLPKNPIKWTAEWWRSAGGWIRPGGESDQERNDCKGLWQALAPDMSKEIKEFEAATLPPCGAS
jgi:hypothetical protein